MSEKIDHEMSVEESDEFLKDGFDREFGDEEIPHVEFKESNSAFGQRIREFELLNKGFKNI